MKLSTFLTTFILLLASTSGSTAPTQDIEQLKAHVLSHVTEYYIEVFGKKEFENNVEIQISHLDSRLRLAKCDDNLAFKINEPPHNVRNITVKTTCMGEQRWTVYVPATVQMFGEVLVIERNLQRGAILTDEDISYRRVDISAAGNGVISDSKRAKGMSLKRPMKVGEVLRLSYLVKPNIVHKGETVILASGSRFLSVETSGVALVSGHMGERIRVKNSSSNRVVDAEVVAPGRAIIANR